MSDFDDAPANPAQAARKLLGALDRRKWPAIVTFLVLLSAAITSVTYLPDVYRSVSTVLIERQQIPDELVRSTVTSALEIRIRTMTNQVLSFDNLQALISKHGLYPEMRAAEEPVQEIVEQMRKDVRISMGGREQQSRDHATIAFTVSYDAPEAATAAYVANDLSSFYIQENLRSRGETASATAEFLRTQLQQARSDLDRLEKRVSEFKQTNIGSLPQQLEANLATLEQLNGQLRLNSDRQAQNSERRTVLEAQKTELMGALVEGRTANERLAVMHATLADLKTRYSDKHPDVIRLKLEISSLEQQVRESEGNGSSETTFVNPHLAQIQLQVDELGVEARLLQKEAEGLRASIARYQRRVEATPSREQEFSGLAREYETAQERYRSLVQREREAQLAESMEERQKGEQFRVLDPALPAREPTAPKRPLLYALGVLLALGAGVAVAIGLEVIDPSLRSPDEVRDLTSIPVIVSLPRIVTEAEKRIRRRRLALGAILTATSVVLIAGASYLVARDNTALTSFLIR